MIEFKGKYYKKTKYTPHNLFGAHFDYFELFDKLLKLKNNNLRKNKSVKNISSNRIIIEAKNKNDNNKIQLKKIKIVNSQRKNNNSFNDIFFKNPLTNKNIFNFKNNYHINNNLNINKFVFERINNKYLNNFNQIFLSKTVDLSHKKNIKKNKSLNDISVFKINCKI